MATVSFSDHVEKIIYEIPTYEVSSELAKEVSTEKTNEEVDKKSEEKKYNSHTKFCTFGINKCRKGVRCIYAHTFKQLNPILCKWDEECLRKEKCYFKHSNETKVQYVKRAFPEDLKRLNIVLYDTLDETVNTSSLKFLKNMEESNETKETNETKEKNEKNEKNNIITDFDEEYKTKLTEFLRMYYDPAFECYSWADINEFVDSDDDE